MPTLFQQAVALENGLIERGFRGDRDVFQNFRHRLRAGLPPGTDVAVRGSVLTNEKHNTGEPFDHAGAGTSDIDVSLVGDMVMQLWREDSFYLPGVNTLPLSDENPDAAPALDGLRRELQDMVGRPVNFQAQTQWLLDLRKHLHDEPYLTILKQNGAFPAQGEPLPGPPAKGRVRRLRTWWNPSASPLVGEAEYEVVYDSKGRPITVKRFDASTDSERGGLSQPDPDADGHVLRFDLHWGKLSDADTVPTEHDVPRQFRRLLLRVIERYVAQRAFLRGSFTKMVRALVRPDYLIRLDQYGPNDTPIGYRESVYSDDGLQVAVKRFTPAGELYDIAFVEDRGMPG